MPELSILLVGDLARSEFSSARSVLEDYGRVSVSASAEQAAALLAGGMVAADLIVVAQAFPGQFPPAQMERLRALAPLARIVGLLGSWCEGELRTGRAWPGAIRVYWHQWLAGGQRELGRLARRACSAWALPMTATEEERLLHQADVPWPPQQGLIAVAARSLEMADWLMAACRGRGWATVWLRGKGVSPWILVSGVPPDTKIQGLTPFLRGVTAAIFDGSDLCGEEPDQLRRLAAAAGAAPVLVLLDPPRIDEQRRALAAGAAAVLAKPVQLADLFWQLDHLR